MQESARVSARTSFRVFSKAHSDEPETRTWKEAAFSSPRSFPRPTRGRKSFAMSGSLLECLLSGFAGAVCAQLIGVLWSEHKRVHEYRALLVGIVVECDYDLSIVDEVTNGVVNHQGSFKRLSVDFFRSARESAVKFSMEPELISALSRICVDLDLFNREADYVFDGDEHKSVYAGSIGDSPLIIEQNPNGHDINRTVLAARLGVTESLEHLKSEAERLLGGD